MEGNGKLPSILLNHHVTFAGRVVIYFIGRIFGCGARCARALAAAVFAGFELRAVRNTEEAALAARALVFALA